MADNAIVVDNVSKLYKLYDKPSDRLKESLGLSKKQHYREYYALHNVSFNIGRGECVGIIGTNGAGKSTILKIITGVLNPTEGNVTINGRISALLELGAGFNMEYTGLENVYLNGTMIGFSREEIDSRLEEILAFADIGDYINQPVKTYSSGMFVRLAFAVAINIDPEILIVDEALSVGDVFFQAKCFKKFEEFKDRGKTILFVSHDLSSIQKYCDKAIFLDKGVKVAEGLPAAMIDLYKKAQVGLLDADDVEEKESVDSTEVKAAAVKNTGKAWKENLPINPAYQSYGDMKAEIADFAIIDQDGNHTGTLIKGKSFTIKVKIRANEEIDNPIVAFTIKDLKGTDLTGTNTLFERIETGEFSKGEERVVSFTQDMNLQGGQYLLSLGCTQFENDDFHVYHRLYDICSIGVVSDKNSVGFFDMNSDIVVERVE